MGAWGPGPFENDDAADWVYELLAADDMAPARDALAAATDSESWLEVPEGAQAVAAAAVVAAGFDGQVQGFPEEVVEWLGFYPRTATMADARLAMDALTRVAGADSELREVWLDAAEGPAWVEQIALLAYRLGRIVGDEAV